MHKFTVLALRRFKIRVRQGVRKLYFEPFSLFFWDFVFFFSFLKWNHVEFGLQLVYSVLMHMFTVFELEKFKIRVYHRVSGCRETLFYGHSCLFAEICHIFLQFFTLESCYIWFTISLEYPSAYLYRLCPGKIQNGSLSVGIRGT